MPSDRNFIQSLAKGLSVLQALADTGNPLNLSEIALAVGQNTTTATRLCHTLTKLGYLARDQQRRYYLTPKVLALGYAVVSGLDWTEVAHRHLEALFSKLNETVSLGARSDSEIIYIDRIRRQKYIPFDIRIGTKLPMHCTAVGKALLAWSPAEMSDDLLETLQYQALTPCTILDAQALKDALDETRAHGFAINDEELIVGNRALAVPVMDSHGWAIAAINVAAPTKRLTIEEMIEKFVPALQESAKQLSTDWGHLQSPVTREMLEGGVTPMNSKHGI